MKKILFMAIAAFAITFSTNAQVQRKADTTRKEMRQMGPRQGYAKLDLTQAQKDQLQKLRDENMEQRKAIQSDQNLTQEQKAAKMKELGKSQQEKRNAILTKEQQEKLKTSQNTSGINNKKAGVKGKSQGQRGGQGNQFAKLDLTQAQKDKMQNLRKENMAQRKAIQENNSLSKEQKAEKMKELNKSQREKMNAVLTPEQQAKMKEAAQKRQHDGDKKDWKNKKDGQKNNIKKKSA